MKTALRFAALALPAVALMVALAKPEWWSLMTQPAADRLVAQGDYSGALRALGSRTTPELESKRKAIGRQWGDYLARKGEYREAADILMGYGGLSELDLRAKRTEWAQTLFERGAYREATEQLMKAQSYGAAFFRSYLVWMAGTVVINQERLGRDKAWQDLVERHRQDRVGMLEAFHTPLAWQKFGEFQLSLPIVWVPGVRWDKAMEDHFLTLAGQEGSGQLYLGRVPRQASSGLADVKGWILQSGGGWSQVQAPGPGLLFRTSSQKAPHLSHSLYVVSGQREWGIIQLVLPAGAPEKTLVERLARSLTKG